MPKRYEGSRLYLHIFYTMKKFFYVAVLAIAFASCGQAEKAQGVDTATQNVTISADGQQAQENAVATENLPENVELGAKKEAVKEAVKGAVK